MKTRHGIAVAGTVLVDKICEIDTYPRESELTKIKSISRAVGGCVPNVSIDVKKIAPSLPVLAIGRLGADSDGEFVRQALMSAGVNTYGLVASREHATGFTDVMSVPGGQRTFFTHSGANSVFGKIDIDFDTLDVKMLHLGYFLLLDKIDGGEGLEILREANERGIKTSIDLVSESSDRYSLVIPALRYTDNLIINEIEASGITKIAPKVENLEKMAHVLKEMGVRERVIIHTASTSLCLSDEGVTTLPSFKLQSGYIKGTTGAGDAFSAGALVGIHDGLSDMELMELASAAATASLSTPDATSGLIPKESLLSLTKNMERQ